ncbi:MAG: zinc ribbon domain-containing protein [Clostridiaceae bacterium]|nr:zinc ribbon domain-containing protein [Clostridiaceae bacterium]
MFFIGVFGVNQAQKPIGVYNNAICPSCGKLTRFEILKTYSYLHMFFIPTFRWNNRYLVKATCCDSVFELDPETGRQFEKGAYTEIRNENLRPLFHGEPFKYCSACNVKVEPHFRFCPYCGRQL